MTNPNLHTRPISLPALRIFVSYHRKNSSFGTKLVRDLHSVMYDDNAVWYTVDGDPQPGNPWPGILQELSTRNVYIFVLSPDAVSSSWVNSEMSIALRQHISQAGKLIPVIYRRCKIPAGYDILQTVSFRHKPYDVAFNELLLTLMGLPAKKVGTILTMRLLLFLFIFLFLIGVSIGSLLTRFQLLKPTPTTQVSASATVPPGTTRILPTSTALTQPTIPGTVPPSIVTTTPLPNLYPNPPGTLNSDPLDNDCQFLQGTYHESAVGQLSQLGQFHIESCYGGNSVSNFVYEIQMTIVKGDFGGIIFRYRPPPTISSSQRYYDFLVGSGGMYQLIIAGTGITFLAKGSSPFINKGLNVQNTLAVVTSGNHIDLYINQHIVASVNDASFSQGQIGISALGVNNQTDVAFTNPKIWIL